LASIKQHHNILNQYEKGFAANKRNFLGTLNNRNLAQSTIDTHAKSIAPNSYNQAHVSGGEIDLYDTSANSHVHNQVFKDNLLRTQEELVDHKRTVTEGLNKTFSNHQNTIFNVSNSPQQGIHTKQEWMKD
jgi:hypothetical protein|tara:strand:- start:486 stop:878 length:393 start_codon:yes stop_codon:yes gene_type:complete